MKRKSIELVSGAGHVLDAAACFHLDGGFLLSFYAF